MKFWFSIFLLYFCNIIFSQNVQVDSQTYTPQQLIEDILIDSNCITNVVVTNVVGGNFGGTDQSYGYFDAIGTNFPFQRGIVLSTGRLSNVQGPNTTLSDDNAPNWGGDNDLENILNENNTINATILEFEFTSLSNLVRFRYLFASEEYQIGNSNTCRFSDLFGFLIREVSDTQFTNIALVPDTQTPVKVTTIHPEIPGGCEPQNERFFGSWNDTNAPINFNGQTSVLSATANVVPGQTYHVKLVIADEQNFRFDSAVFLEAGGLQLSTDLGSNRLIANNNALCENDTLELNALQPGNNSYKWFKDGVEILGEISETYTVVNAGIYEVEVLLQNGCTVFGEIIVEYSANPTVVNSTITECDTNLDGLTVFNLFDAVPTITNGDNALLVSDFFLTFQDAEQNISTISNSQSFQNSVPQQIVYARVENQLRCFSIAEITLNTSNNTINLPAFEICDDDTNDGITAFNVNDIINYIQPFAPNGSAMQLFINETDAFQDANAITGTYTNTDANSQTIYVKIENNGGCYAIDTLELIVNARPVAKGDSTYLYCLSTFPQTINISSGIPSDYSPSNYSYQWFLNNQPLTFSTPTIDVNEAGNYRVIETNSSGCTASGNIVVIPSNIATIQSVNITQGTSNNTVTVEVSGEGDYQFALDIPVYTDSNVFTNVKPGFHTVYILDKNGCGTIQQQISVLGFPKFFTPNNDGFQDTWKPFGVNGQFNSDIRIQIFDRYGKLLKTLNPFESGWDGTFNGALMANDDYWYAVFLPDGSTYKGHFTLKR